MDADYIGAPLHLSGVTGKDFYRSRRENFPLYWVGEKSSGGFVLSSYKNKMQCEHRALGRFMRFASSSG